MRLKKKNQLKSETSEKPQTGWFCGTRETFDEIIAFYNEIENNGLVVSYPYERLNTHDGVWKFRCKVSKA